MPIVGPKKIKKVDNRRQKMILDSKSKIINLHEFEIEIVLASC